jgi:hypothetical protein
MPPERLVEETREKPAAVIFLEKAACVGCRRMLSTSYW